jgi:hypothetical protein
MKGSMVGATWNLEAERACFSSPGAFKTYADLWEGKNQALPMSGEGQVQFLGLGEGGPRARVGSI